MVWFTCSPRDFQESLQHHNLKASVLQPSAFFIVQISQQYKTTGKAITLTICNFVSKVMSLLFHILPMFLITFLLRSKFLLISWLQSPSTAILELKKIKSVTTSTLPPSVFHEVMWLDVMILGFWILSFHSLLSHSRGSLIQSPLSIYDSPSKLDISYKLTQTPFFPASSKPKDNEFQRAKSSPLSFYL